MATKVQIKSEKSFLLEFFFQSWNNLTLICISYLSHLLLLSQPFAPPISAICPSYFSHLPLLSQPFTPPISAICSSYLSHLVLLSQPFGPVYLFLFNHVSIRYIASQYPFEIYLINGKI